jgi:ADP-heptose:LPS heptosyltransferase
LSRRVLVIRLGALGDFFLSFPAFAAIRAHEAAAEITLLTTAPYADVARGAPWFERVTTDRKPAPWNLPGLVRLAGQLRGYDIVYDLQTSRRSNWYFRLAGRPPWSGIAPGCALLHANPLRDAMHTRERQRDQLAMAGIRNFRCPDISWLGAAAPEVPPPYAILVPGAAVHRPAKRWPSARYAALAEWFRGRGITPVVVGAKRERELASTIPAAVDLTGRTDLAGLAALARGASLAVGNDTGPMHVAASVGCPCVVLFSADSDPALTAPRGPCGAWPVVLRVPDLKDLPLEKVVAALS